jgi:hypothetical protein
LGVFIRKFAKNWPSRNCLPYLSNLSETNETCDKDPRLSAHAKNTKWPRAVNGRWQNPPQPREARVMQNTFFLCFSLGWNENIKHEERKGKKKRKARLVLYFSHA